MSGKRVQSGGRGLGGTVTGPGRRAKEVGVTRLAVCEPSERAGDREIFECQEGQKPLGWEDSLEH